MCHKRCRFLTSCLCDRWFGGGLHRHGRGCSIADGGGREISETCLSSHSLAARTAPIAERVLDNSLEKVASGTSRSTSNTTADSQNMGRLCMFFCVHIAIVVPSYYILTPAAVSQYVYSPVPLPEGLRQTLRSRRR